MIDLPELSDDQIDTAYHHMKACCGPIDRENVLWRDLRSSFPATPPKWENGEMAVTVATAHEHSLPYDAVGVWVACGTYGLMSPRVAREMAAAITDAADWIEANR